ncbi:MAG: presenilin family intramembrane aspartyl protease [Candidatus Bathyarchaeota archaeon]|nr:presenilin family intramembrane aspartyl protease [Candidatus Bathyarchaeota archaeon]
MSNLRDRITANAPFLAMGSFFVLVDLLALYLTTTFNANGAILFEDPNDPFNLLSIVTTTLMFSGAILVFAKLRLIRILKIVFLFSTGSMIMIVVYFLTIGVIADPLATILSSLFTVGLITLLVKHPEWYIVDITGVILGVGSAALFGISLNVPLVVILLTIMAVYDAISVYKTRHMIALADTFVALRIPAMLVVPNSRGYSFMADTQSLKSEPKQGGRRAAFFLGLGDIVFPGILVVSVFNNITGNGLTIAFSVMAGTLLGYIVLLRFAAGGKPQAGLPFLCTGALVGYFASTFLLYSRFFV